MIAARYWWRSPAFRLGLVVIFVLAAILVPFALWRDQIDAWANDAFSSGKPVSLTVIATGVFLLIADTWLPVPSSLVAVFLCLRLGPVVGGVMVAVGSLAAFVTGYLTGRLLPESLVRNWVGEPVWIRAARAANDNAFWWIALARPLPVLAEASAICAGVWRVGPGLAFLYAAVSSAVLGALYGVATHLGQRAPSLPALILAMALLPVLFWILHRVLRRKLCNQG